MIDQAKEITPPNVHERRLEQVEGLRRLSVYSNEKITSETGGSHGIRDNSALESAVSAPFASFGGEDLHPDPVEKAAVLMRSLSLNHPFLDGNKRTSLAMTAALLFEYGIGFKEQVPDDSIVDFCIEVAMGRYNVSQIAAWIKDKTDSASTKNFLNVVEKLREA